MEELSLEGGVAARLPDVLELNIINTTNETFEGDTHTVYHLEVKSITSGVSIDFIPFLIVLGKKGS